MRDLRNGKQKKKGKNAKTPKEYKHEVIRIERQKYETLVEMYKNDDRLFKILDILLDAINDPDLILNEISSRGLSSVTPLLNALMHNGIRVKDLDLKEKQLNKDSHEEENKEKFIKALDSFAERINNESK